MLSKIIFCLLGLTAATYAVDTTCNGSGGKEDKMCEAWDTLRFLWSPEAAAVPTNMVPLSASEGVAANKYPKGVSLASCKTQGNNGAEWWGYRAQYGDTKSVMILFDKQGSVAGIQHRYRKAAVNATFPFRYDLMGAYQTENVDGEVYYVLTAYFVDPKTICSTGRPASALKTNNGVGNGLWIQDGKTPDTLWVVPRYRPDAISSGQYSDNKCFPGMGSHAFCGLDQWQSNGCTQIRGHFALYNYCNYLIGFGFARVGKNEDEKSFESPPSAAIKMIVGSDKTPKCLTDLADDKNIGVTTMHVFFVKRNPSKLCTSQQPIDKCY